MLLLFLELLTAMLGAVILYVEVIKNRFLNYATSIFLLGFVPLLCIYPVIARLAVGGAYTIRRGSDEVITDPWVYVCYQTFCLALLVAMIATRKDKITDRPLVGWRDKFRLDPVELACFVGLVGLGVAMYVYSTGYGVIDLINASRFEYFNNPDYSPAAFVISTYLVAASPIALLLALQQKRDRWAVVALVFLLVLYGLMAKDRKWLIYIVSAGFAFVYIKNGYSITFRRKAVAPIIAVFVALAFWQVARSVLFSYYVSGVGDPLYDSQQVALNLLTRGDFPYYYNASITAIDMHLNENFLIPFAVLRRQLFFFLPADYSLGLKIEDISALFSDAIGGEDEVRRGNMPPGFFGLFAISFGWFGGLIFSALIPLGLRALDRFIHRSRGIGSIVVVAHLLSSVTLLLRGDDSSATYFVISSLALFYMLRILFQPQQVLVPARRRQRIGLAAPPLPGEQLGGRKEGV